MTEPPALPPDVSRLLEAERATEGVSEVDRERARAALLAAIGSGDAKPRGAPGGPSQAGARPGGAPAVMAAAGALIVGGALGFLLGREFPASRPRPPAQAPPAASLLSHSPEPAPSAVPALAAAPSASVARAPGKANAAPGAPPRGPSSASSSKARGFAEERALLERARSALARGDGEAALAAADEHARSFSSGALAEEREVLAIRALFLQGKGELAQRRRAAFRTKWPSSMFLPALDELEGGNSPSR